MSFKRIISIGGFLGLLLGCSSNNNPSSPSEKIGSVYFRVAMAADSPFKKLAKSVELTISASDMITMVKKLEVKDSTIEGAVTGIPSGSNRTFEVKVYDSTGTVRYKGITSGNIIPDSTINLSLSILRIVGSAKINGAIVESPNGWIFTDDFESATLNPKWKPYSASIGALTSTKAHAGNNSFQVTYSDFKYTLDSALTNGKISWWYYDNSGTPWTYFYILTDTSKTDLTIDNLHMDTQNPTKYYFQDKTKNVTAINRVVGWRNIVAKISNGTVTLSIDGQVGITLSGSLPIIGFQIAGGIMDDFSVESYSI